MNLTSNIVFWLLGFTLRTTTSILRCVALRRSLVRQSSFTIHQTTPNNSSNQWPRNCVASAPEVLALRSTEKGTTWRPGSAIQQRLRDSGDVGSQFIQAIYIAPLQVNYHSEALPTQHVYCAGVSRRNATCNCE